jgi:hypothetical protein
MMQHAAMLVGDRAAWQTAQKCVTFVWQTGECANTQLQFMAKYYCTAMDSHKKQKGSDCTDVDGNKDCSNTKHMHCLCNNDNNNNTHHLNVYSCALASTGIL